MVAAPGEADRVANAGGHRAVGTDDPVDVHSLPGAWLGAALLAEGLQKLEQVLDIDHTFGFAGRDRVEGWVLDAELAQHGNQVLDRDLTYKTTRCQDHIVHIT